MPDSCARHVVVYRDQWTASIISCAMTTNNASIDNIPMDPVTSYTSLDVYHLIRVRKARFLSGNGRKVPILNASPVAMKRHYATSCPIVDKRHRLRTDTCVHLAAGYQVLRIVIIKKRARMTSGVTLTESVQALAPRL